jgi:hypothetical protein
MGNTLTPAELQAIAARAEGASGPFHVVDGYEIWNADALVAEIYGTEGGQAISEGDEADAEFLAGSYADVKALLSHIRELEGRLRNSIHLQRDNSGGRFPVTKLGALMPCRSTES